MKKSEMVEYIKTELLEFHERYSKANEKRKKHLLQNNASGILDMMLGFGMLPPPVFPMDKNDAGVFYDWEDE